MCGGELGRNERHICLDCLADMPLTWNWDVVRNQMAERFNAMIERHGGVGGASDESVSGGFGEVSVHDGFARYVYAAALFNFEKDGGYRHITYRLKYGRDLAEGRFFAAMLGERLAGTEIYSDVDVVVPVPLHWTRRMRRGYNQAEIIAAELAKALGAKLETGILVRNRRTSTQTKLGIEEKARNVSGAFALNRRFIRHYDSVSESRTFQGRDSYDGSTQELHDSTNGRVVNHILLVDDVFTTGSTLYNCWRPLHEFFGPSVRISIATLGVV